MSVSLKHLQGKIFHFLDHRFLFIDEGEPFSHPMGTVTQKRSINYGNGEFNPNIAFVKRQGELWITHQIGRPYIWTVAEFERLEILDHNPKVLLVELEDIWLHQRDWLAHLETRLIDSPLHKTTRVLAGDFPIDLDYIKKAIT